MLLKYNFIDLEEPLDLLPSIQEHCRLEGSNVLGFFDHFAGIGYVTKDAVNDPPILTFESFLEDLKAGADQSDDILSYLTKRTVAIHESRHFFDCFCTPEGFSLFKEYCGIIGMMGNIVRGVIRWKHKEGNKVEYPISKYFLQPDVPQNLKSWWEHSKDHLFSITIDVGYFPLKKLDGHDSINDFTILSGRFVNGKKFAVPCVHVNIINSSGKEERILWPVGFCLILECLSVITQGSFIADFGRELVFDFRKGFQKLGANPYTALIGTLNRVFKSRGYSPDDNDHFKIAFRSLFLRVEDFIAKSSRNKAPIGWSLLLVLEDYVEIENDKFKWVGPTLDRSEFQHKTKYQKGLPDDLISYVEEMFYRKAMTTNTPFVEYDSMFGWLSLQDPIPNPPIIFVSDGDVIISDAKFFQLWINWFMIRELVSSAFSKECFICPVRNPETSWMFKSKKIQIDTQCIKSIKEDQCGIWMPNTDYTGPKCMWSEHLKQLFTDLGE